MTLVIYFAEIDTKSHFSLVLFFAFATCAREQIHQIHHREIEKEVGLNIKKEIGLLQMKNTAQCITRHFPRILDEN